MTAMRILVDSLLIILASFAATVLILAYYSPDTLSQAACDMTTSSSPDYNQCRSLTSP